MISTRPPKDAQHKTSERTPMALRQKTIPSDEQAWESYRLYQRDVLLSCVQDAELMMKRAHLPQEDRATFITLLFEKRCQPWKFFRDEQRALSSLRN
jgi:hypothetical protein